MTDKYMGNMVFQFQLHTDNLNVPLPEEERGVNKEMYIWNRKSREERLRIVAHGQQVFGLAMLERLSAQGENVVAVCRAPTKAGMHKDLLVIFAKSKIFQYLLC